MINKSDLLERLEYASKWNTPVSKWVFDVIRNAPDALIRCERCKYCINEDRETRCRSLGIHVSADDYCSRGRER